MKITIFGLAITSSWGNGHATTFRALCSALHKRGHRTVFFEHNLEWYQNNRDLPEPDYCDVRIFERWNDILPRVRAELRDTDVAVIGSYFPDGIAALDEVLESNVPIKAFYDIDTPITVAALEQQGKTDYLLKHHLPKLDIYFSFTGGPTLKRLEEEFSVPFAVPLYCSYDPEKYHKLPPVPRFECDLSYMGTYAPDRQPKIEELFCEPARRLPRNKFILAGPQYPKSILWPGNVERIMHLDPCYHAALYGSSRLTLNVTRRDMVMAGFSPSVRLFEATACAAAIVSDNWPGLDSFFVPGREILLAQGSDDVVRYLSDYDTDELSRIGSAAQARVLAKHTSDARALEFEQAVEESGNRMISRSGDLKTRFSGACS
ncbi:MAG TPA: glycosyltransferase [Candidatus Angelobacter sp.]|jgi:spore maturation protein CgeB|nr:glycosyltransferase [Candidatus Angelobacter sp.]